MQRDALVSSNASLGVAHEPVRAIRRPTGGLRARHALKNTNQRKPNPPNLSLCDSEQGGSLSAAASMLSSQRRLQLVVRSTSSSAAAPLEGGYDADARHSPLAAKIRGFLFYLWTFTLALPLFVAMVLQAPFVLLFDKHRRLAQHFVNDVWAKTSTRLFYKAKVEGRENLPAPSEPAVYIANHQSFLDIFTLFHLNRPFKFISKTSIFFIPIVGWSMFLTGHVRLNRLDRRSQMACLTKCRELLQKGASVLFFPEGTRATDCRLQEFKKVVRLCLLKRDLQQSTTVFRIVQGAFSVAAKAGVPVIPITLIGTGRKMPNKQEDKMFPGDVNVIIHPRVEPGNADKMLEQARQAVLSRLPQQMHPVEKLS